MKSSIFKQLLLIGMAASIFVILAFRILGSKNSWNDFFTKPKQQEAKLLQKSTPLERTREVDERISGSGKFKENEQINFVFSQMCNAVKEQKEETKVEVVAVPKPAPPPAIETKKLVKRLKKAVPKKALAPKEKDFFPVAYQSDISVKTMNAKSLFSGLVAGEQEVKPGRSLKIITTESFNFDGKTIPEGAYLYGVVSFSQERIYVSIKNAFFDETAVPVELEIYDTDYIVGLLSEDLIPFMESAKKRAMRKASNLSKNEWVREIGSGAVDAIDSLRSEKKVVIENKREVFLKIVEKEKRRR